MVLLFIGIVVIAMLYPLATRPPKPAWTGGSPGLAASSS
jgi:hypothetical protein